MSSSLGSGDVFLKEGAWHQVGFGQWSAAWCGLPQGGYERAISWTVFDHHPGVTVPLSGRCRSCFADDWRRGYLSPTVPLQAESMLASVTAALTGKTTDSTQGEVK